VGTPDHGGTLANARTHIVYTPALDFFGMETFTYTVSDGQGGFTTATVIVTVTAVNDAPLAVDDAASTPQDTPVVIPVLANDRDVEGDSLTVWAVGAALQGTTALVAPDSVRYMPGAVIGRDSFTYTVSDGQEGFATAQVVVTVTASTGNRAPVADAGGDQGVLLGAEVALDGSGSVDPDGDPLTYRWTQDGGPRAQFTPALSVITFTAPAQRTVLTFTLTVTDPGELSDYDRAIIKVRNPIIYLPLVMRDAP
jgi:hypothetical protein